jgi:quercetin dioxygenase-like cupin family protein
VIRFSTDEIARFDDGAPVMQTLAESIHSRVVLICLKAGQGLKEHRAPSQIQIQVLRGAIRILAEGRELPGGPGDLLVVPPGGRHRVEASEESVLVATVTPHPAAGSFPADRQNTVITQAPHQAI